MKNYKHKRDYAVYEYEEFKAKSFIDHSRSYPSTMNKIEDNYNKQNIKGLHELVMDVIDQFTDDIQRKLLHNIIIFGSDENGICNVQNAHNLEQRLVNQLHDLLFDDDDDDDDDNKETLDDQKHDIDINVTCIPEKNAVFCFASYLTKFREFGVHWITKEEYEMEIDGDLETLCHLKWHIDKYVNDKFNDILSNDQFYLQMYDCFKDDMAMFPVF